MSMPDLQKYRPFVNDFDMSDEQKDELIMIVWNMMGNFVDQAFGIHPLQLCQKKSAETHLTNDICGTSAILPNESK